MGTCFDAFDQNHLSIHVTFTAIVPGAYSWEAKMCKKSRLAISSPDELLVSYRADRHASRQTRRQTALNALLPQLQA